MSFILLFYLELVVPDLANTGQVQVTLSQSPRLQKSAWVCSWWCFTDHCLISFPLLIICVKLTTRPGHSLKEVVRFICLIIPNWLSKSPRLPMFIPELSWKLNKKLSNLIKGDHIDAAAQVDMFRVKTVDSFLLQSFLSEGVVCSKRCVGQVFELISWKISGYLVAAWGWPRRWRCPDCSGDTHGKIPDQGLPGGAYFFNWPHCVSTSRGNRTYRWDRGTEILWHFLRNQSRRRNLVEGGRGWRELVPPWWSWSPSWWRPPSWSCQCAPSLAWSEQGENVIQPKDPFWPPPPCLGRERTVVVRRSQTWHSHQVWKPTYGGK